MVSFIIVFILASTLGHLLYRSHSKLNKNFKIENQENTLLINTENSYSEEIKFLAKVNQKFNYNYDKNSYEIDFQFVKENLKYCKGSFIENVFNSQIKGGENLYGIDLAQIKNLFSKHTYHKSGSNFGYLEDFNDVLKYTLSLETNIDSKFALETFYFGYLFNLLKDLYTFNSELHGSNAQRKDLITLFRDHKETDIISDCIQHIATCNRIKDKFKLKNLDNYFNYNSNLKLDLINKILDERLENSDDSLENLEFKVTANTIKNEILPKINEYEKEGFEDKSLSENTLDKILIVLDQNKIEDKSSVEMELKIINRYLDALNKDTINV